MWRQKSCFVATFHSRDKGFRLRYQTHLLKKKIVISYEWNLMKHILKLLWVIFQYLLVLCGNRIKIVWWYQHFWFRVKKVKQENTSIVPEGIYLTMYLFLNYNCNKLMNSIFKFDVLCILGPRNKKLRNFFEIVARRRL